ncbi:MAG: hypothetical protein HY909_09115 [Deltaproteobacteria bacterium]|nr:hypothetical protein [Deltaproteobacteria bacterium]
MERHTRATVWALTASLLAGSAALGQNLDRPGWELLQRTVGTGAQGALVGRPSGAAAVTDDPSRAVPSGRVVGTGPDARFEPAPDAQHGDISVARMGNGWALAWTDGHAGAVYFGRVSATGAPVGVGLRLRAAVEDGEEAITGPSVIASADGGAVAWADPAGGRVWFRRVGADGAARGPAVLVHDGLESPRAVRLVWTGREYGLAVSLWQGVYFTRLGGDGQRLGDATMVAEGSTVRRIEAIHWDGRGYQLSWSEDQVGGSRILRQRVDAVGRRDGAAVLGLARPASQHWRGVL